MTFMPRFVLPDLDAPQPVGERYGLFAAAGGPFEMPNHAVGGGISYYPTSCGFTREYDIECGPTESPGESPGDIYKVFDPGTPFTEGDPFALYSTIQCGSAGLGALAEDAVETIRRRLDLRFANGVQTGVESAASTLFALSGAPELEPPDASNIWEVLATLEQWLYGRQDVDTVGGGTSPGQGYGFRGFIHTTPRVAAYAQREHLIEPDPDNRRLWRTAMGTVWVFGGGYSGALPGAAAAVSGTDGIYITGQTTVWKNTPEIKPDLRQTFDRETNQWMALQEGVYMVTWDCAIAAAPFTWGVGSP